LAKLHDSDFAESRSQSKIEAFGYKEKLSRPKISQFTLYPENSVHGRPTPKQMPNHASEPGSDECLSVDLGVARLAMVATGGHGCRTAQKWRPKYLLFLRILT
jgi:hypothetical protein